jgi:hypothetical protein
LGEILFMGLERAHSESLNHKLEWSNVNTAK